VVASHHRADAFVDPFAQAVDKARVTQPEALRDRRRFDLDPAECVAGGANALEIHVARKLVSAGPERLQRWRQMRLELNEAADGWRCSFPHRDAHALWHRRSARRFKALDADDNPVAALALLAHLDKSGNRRARHGMLQDGMSKTQCLQRGDRKS
jgi:hypothetical protein